MKKVFTLLAAILIYYNVWSQSPEKMSYQAVVRNSSDVLVTNTQLGMQISILQGSETGTEVYIETQTPTTNANGLVSIEIGGGTVQIGDFIAIDWANGPYFIKTETDPEGGSNYAITGTSQLLSVPYALHSKTAETVIGGTSETDPTFTAWDKSSGISITESQISDLQSYLATEVDPAFTDWDKATGIVITESQISDLQTYITAETDPTFTAWDKSSSISITESQISDLQNYATLDMADQSIINLADPINDQDAATKAYVEGVMMQLYAQGALRVRDYDGNYYNTIKIGNQIWMAENLKSTRYSNGDSIADGTGKGDISVGTEPKYWFAYNDDLANISVYGNLYTWHTVYDSRNVCPNGWHVPNNSEWTQLVEYLGGEFIAGGKLKENGTIHWYSPNMGATNESGFTALPSGTRGYGGFFGNIAYGGNWWSLTETTTIEGYSWGLSFSKESIYYGGSDKKVGFSVRCLKN